MDNSVPQDVFPGFWPLDQQLGYTQLPHEFIDILNQIDSLTELKIILYIFRHTWGFQEFNTFKKITTDEFMCGRKSTNKETDEVKRMDNGTGLSDWGVKDGIAKALKHGYILCKVDAKDKARIKKSYMINIYKQQ